MIRVTDERALWLARNVLPHEPALRSWLAGKRLRGVELDDIVQETYSILAGLPSVDGVRNPKPYLFQTAYSVILAQLRRPQIVSISTMDDIEQLAGGDQAPSPETEASDRQELHRLAEAIAGLPARCREAFVLRKIEGLTQREVAQRMGVSEGTIEKQMHKALQQLVVALGRGGIAPAQASRSRKSRRAKASRYL